LFDIVTVLSTRSSDERQSHRLGFGQVNHVSAA
jgi:hypothetical protein